jgi:hypothetical protein
MVVTDSIDVAQWAEIGDNVYAVTVVGIARLLKQLLGKLGC